MTEIRGLTIRQPWAHAIAHHQKTIENRGWTTAYRGLIAIHAAASAGPRDEWEYAADRVAALASVPIRDVEDGMRTRSAIVAVAYLSGICSTSYGIPHGVGLACECGPWAMPRQRHLHLIGVRALERPLPCKGALGLWRVPPAVAVELEEQTRTVRS
ncbi:hypothetical protein [Actinomadura sp. GTD37]|uniref:hypothetical protein n=1 Tax=Actinomadura sp. GTD37 TaxID=1778030 RepID=UPI0035C21A53